MLQQSNNLIIQQSSNPILFMNTPEYMKDEESSKEKSSFPLVPALLLIIIVMLAVLLTVNLLPEESNGANSWTAKQQRALAVKLKTAGLENEAVQAFNKYLDNFDISNDERAQLFYTIGKIHFDNQNFEDALKAFYSIEIIKPGSSQNSEAGRYIVTSLEKLGKSLDAKYELNRVTALENKPAPSGGRGVLVAKVGDDEIFMGDLIDEIQKFPPQQQKMFDKPEEEINLLEQMISRILLVEKARVLGFDKSEEVKNQLNEIEKSLLVQKVITSELEERVKIKPDDIKLFYETHPEFFKDSQGTNAVAAKVLPFAEVKDRAEQIYRSQKEQEAVKEFMNELISLDRVQVFSDRIKNKESK